MRRALLCAALACAIRRKERAYEQREIVKEFGHWMPDLVYFDFGPFWCLRESR